MLGLGLGLWRATPGIGGNSGGLAAARLGAEAQGIAVDFTDMSIVIRDTSTPANNYTGNPNSKLTYSSPSTKWVLGANGLWSSGTSLRTAYDTSGNALGLQAEETRTNLRLHSNDLTQAAWTKSNMTTALTATGPDGASNSATTLTATAGNATALQSITSASAARVSAVFIKRRTGTGNIDITQDNGTTWATQSVTSSWTRFSIAVATITNPIVGIRIVTSGDAVDVWCFNHEVGSFVTSPIVTAGATVTRATDNITLATTAAPSFASAVTMYARGISPPFTTGAGARLLALGTDGNNYDNLGMYNDQRVYGHNVVAASDLLNRSIASAYSTDLKAAMALSTNDGILCKGGTLSASSATANPQSRTNLHFGSLPGSPFPWNGYIKQVMVLPRRMSNADLQTLTT